MNRFGIDVYTCDMHWLRLRLSRLASVVSAELGGIYHAIPECAQVHVTTTMTEEQLEDWLYTRSVGEWIGVFPLEAEGDSHD